MMTVAAVRLFRPADRVQIGEIAYRTGFMGESAEAFWPHRESYVAIWIAPYLISEPESVFVATLDERVVGYLTGCLNTVGFNGPDAVMMKEVSRHGLLFRVGVAKFLWRAMFDDMLKKWRGQPPVRGELLDPRWPSHLHMNLLPEARGAGLGRALMEAWLARLRSAGSAGCHLSAINENDRAVAFFKTMGFEPYGTPVPIPGMRGRRGERLHQQIMVQSTR